MRFGSYAKVSERGNPSSPHPLFPRMREPIFTPSVVPAYAGTHLHPIRCSRVCGNPSSPHPLSSRMRGPIFPYPLGHLHPRRGVPCGRPSCVAHTSPFRSPHERGIPSSSPPLSSRMRGPIFVPSVVLAYAGTHLHPLSCPHERRIPSSSPPLSSRMRGPIFVPSVVLAYAGTHLHPLSCPRVCGDPSSPTPSVTSTPVGASLVGARPVLPTHPPPLSSRMRGPIFVPSVVLAYAGTHLHPLSCPHERGIPSSPHPLSSRMRGPIFVPSVVLAYAGTHLRPLSCPREGGDPSSPPLLSSRMQEPIFAPSLVLAYAGTHLPLPPQSPPLP